MTKTIILFILSATIFVFPSFLLGAGEYRVDEGDVLKFTVYGHDDLSATVRVSGEGAIIFPLIDQVHVAGLTIPQISAKVASALADGYIIAPKVNVFIEKFRAQNVFVSGEVGQPGAYQFEMDMTLIKVISLAGGFKESASKKDIQISRKVSNKKITITNADVDELIEPGDVIVVPESFLKDIFVTGEVKKPGVYQFEEGITLIKAIALAGSFTDIAAKEKVKIIRKVDGKEEVMTNAQMSVNLESGDVVVVPESFF